MSILTRLTGLKLLNIIIMKKMENKGFYACAVWCNGEYQKGATRFYNDDEEFNSVVENAYSGCNWFTGSTEVEVNQKAWDFMS